MLTIHQPELVSEGQTVTLSAVIDCDGRSQRLWFCVPAEYGQFLCAERADAFLVALLPYARREQHDLRVLAPVSQRLFYTLTEYLIPALYRSAPALPPLRVECEQLAADPLPSAGAVGTGVSCGVDSLFTVSRHTGGDCPEDFRLTHATFFNAGSHGPDGSLFADRLEWVRPFAAELGLPLVRLDSNAVQFAGMPHLAMHTYVNAACVLALQKLFRTYYYSSAYSLDAFKIDLSDPAHYDSYILGLLGTGQLSFFSSGTPHSRAEKTAWLTGYEPSYRFLNVCNVAGKNCAVCEKCLRTLLMLEALGKLDLYDRVFDLEAYARVRDKYLTAVMHRPDDEFARDTRALLRASGQRLPLASYAYHSLRGSLSKSSFLRDAYLAVARRRPASVTV